MKLNKRIYITLALLLAGGANLWADLPEINNPFPGFNFRKWPDYLCVEGYVHQNGEVVKKGTVAIYTEKNELRDVKQIMYNNRYFGNVYGDFDCSVNIYFHFKVYTNGRYYTCYPKPDLTWETIYYEEDEILGNGDPYIIDITPDSLKDVIDNTSLLTNLESDKWPTTVVLPNRVIDNEWNTLTVPFDVTGEQLNETFGQGWSLYEFGNSSLTDGVLSLEFKKANAMEAGKPYFIRVSDEVGSVQNPVFADVKVVQSAYEPSTTPFVDFIPTLNPTLLQGNSIHDFLILGGNNTLYNPSTLDNAWMKGFRGFFQLHDLPENNASGFRLVFDADDDVSGIITLENPTSAPSDIYNLMGQRVEKVSGSRSIQIFHNKKIIYRQ